MLHVGSLSKVRLDTAKSIRRARLGMGAAAQRRTATLADKMPLVSGKNDALHAVQQLGRKPRTDVAILAAWPDMSTKLLAGELKSLGAKPRLIDPRELKVAADGSATYKGKKTRLPQSAISLTMLPDFATLRDMDRAGVHIVNRSFGIELGGDKAAQASVFAANGVPHPRTRVASSLDDLKSAAAEYGFPLVVKAPDGYGGQGVRFPENQKELATVAKELLGEGRQVVAQRFLEKGRNDLRVVVVRSPVSGEPEVVAAMGRYAPAGELLANGPKGNTVKAITKIDGSSPHLPRTAIDAAVKATRAAELDYAGVDVMEAPEGHVVGEINPNPGTIELDVKLPRSHQSLPRVAQYAVYGEARPPLNR